MSFSENNNGFTPSFVSLALSGETHRFILVLECESRQYEGDVAVSHPRFCVGGPRATLDPRNVSINDLLPLGASKVDLPPGWEKVHQLLYVVQPSTDEHGWQYRSSWPTQALEANDENWSNNNASNADVRRRLWMTTVVKRDDVLAAKRKISELILSRQRGVILSGPLLRLEQDENGEKKWVSRQCALLDEKIEIMDEQTGEKVDELYVLGHQIKMLDGFAFSVRKLDGSSCVLFDTDSKETRRRWLIAISYQIAVRGPLIDFAPFPYAPPLGEDVSNRVILCGHLLKKGQTGMNWKSRFFRLTPRELQYYDRDALKGSIKIDGATVKTDEKSLEMCLRSKSGVTVVVKSDNHANKAVWVNAFEAQIEVLAFRIASAARPITAEEKALTISYAGEKEEGDGAGVRNVVIPSVAVKEAETFANSGISSPGGDNHHLTSPFNNYKSPSPAVGFHIDTDITPSKIDPVARSSKSPGSAGRNPLVSFVSSAKLMTDGDDADGDDDSADLAPMSPTYKGDPSLTLVEFITEDDDASTDEGKPDDDFAEGDNDELLDGSKRTLSRKNGSQSSNVDSESGAISALESLDSPDGKGKATSPGKIFRPKSVNFGCQPEKIVSHADFDVAPELLTTAQKVAILESAAYQYRTNQLSIQPREPRKSFIAAPAPTVSANGAIDGYTPTGLRLENPVKVEGHTENDGGAVAKTQDTVVNKISKWEGWSKEKSASPLPPSRTLGK